MDRGRGEGAWRGVWRRVKETGSDFGFKGNTGSRKRKL